MAIIYKITNTLNGKFYIGQTIQSLIKRFNGHKTDARVNNKTNQSLHNAIRKYGFENFICEEIENCPVELLDEREIYWIDKLNATDKNIGYNLDKGGRNSNRIFTEEVRRRISLGLMVKNGNFTGEVRKSYIKRNLGKRISHQRIAIKCINTNVVYESLTQAALDLKLSVGNISDILNGRKKTCNGYSFEKI